MHIKVPILLFFSAISTILYSQNESYFIQSIEKPRLKKKIKNISAITIPIIDTIDDTHFFTDFETKYTGFHDVILNDSIIKIAVYKEELYGYYHPSSISEEADCSYDAVHMSKSWGDGYSYYRDITLDNITVLHTSNILKQYMKAGAWVSFFTAVIITPIVSYNFKSKSINSQKYNPWIASSLSATIFFTTFTIVLKDKDYRIKDYLCNKADWKLIKK